MSEAGEYDERKFQKLQEKTDYVRREFNLPDTEDVIQDYFCLWGAAKGRLYVTENHMCWASSITSTTEKISFRKVTLIKSAKTLGLVSSAIDISTATENYHFSSFVHRDETFNLLMHLWHYPPTFISIEPPEPRRIASAPPAPAGASGAEAGGRADGGKASWRQSGAVRGGAGKGWGAGAGGGADGWGDSDAGGGGGGGGGGRGGAWGGSTSSSSTGWSASGGGGGGGGASSAGNWFGGGERVLTADMVDTKTSENALRIALEAREMGIDTITELEYQAEQIDRIERDVENIHANLDKGDRLMRGIESFGGYLKNKFSSATQIRGTGTAIERKIEWQKRRPEKIDIPVLLKHKNDLLTPATLRIETAQFSVLNESMSKIRGMTWQYEDVLELVVRSRPLHLDVRFGAKLPRFRLVSSYIQPIVNELYFRCTETKIMFEPGLRKFDYGDDRIEVSTMSREQGGGAFFGIKKGTADLLSDEVSVEVKMAVKKQDEDLDQITHLVGEMGQMGIAMGVELERQTEQLGHLTGRVEYANERLHGANNRLERQL